jgi:hypothetical protein
VGIAAQDAFDERSSLFLGDPAFGDEFRERNSWIIAATFQLDFKAVCLLLGLFELLAQRLIQLAHKTDLFLFKAEGDEFGAVEAQDLKMIGSAFGLGKESTVFLFSIVRSKVIEKWVEKAQRRLRFPVVAFELIAGVTAVDQISYLVISAVNTRLKVVKVISAPILVSLTPQ